MYLFVQRNIRIDLPPMIKIGQPILFISLHASNFRITLQLTKNRSYSTALQTRRIQNKAFCTASDKP